MDTFINDVIAGSLCGLFELVGIGAAVALYVSDRRAKTEAEHYIYSPRYKPKMRTPKRSFIPPSLLVSTAFATMEALQTWGGRLNPTLTFIGQSLIWIYFVGLLAALVLFVMTTHSLEASPSNTDEESDDD